MVHILKAKENSLCQRKQLVSVNCVALITPINCSCVGMEIAFFLSVQTKLKVKVYFNFMGTGVKEPVVNHKERGCFSKIIIYDV